MQQNSEIVYYSIGQRDMLANLFLLIRSNGVNATLMELAIEYKKFNEPNPHVEWWINGARGLEIKQ